MPEPRICCISEAEATELLVSGVRPNCRAHASRHISRKEAQELRCAEYGPAKLTQKGTYRYRTVARWVPGYEGKYLIVEAVRRWMPHRGTLQLLPLGAPLGNNRQRARSNGKPSRMVMPSVSQELLAKSRVDGITHS